MNKQKLLMGISILTLLVGLGVADAMLTSSSMLYPASPTTDNDDVGGPIGEEEIVAKAEGPDVLATVAQFKLVPQNSSEQSLLASIVPPGIPVQSRILLLEGDRFCFLAWTEAADAKTYFMALKEALHRSFSPQVTGLLDQVQVREGKPNRNVLTFKDPAIHEERVIFIRSRERLYEIHIPDGREATVQALMDALTE